MAKLYFGTLLDATSSCSSEMITCMAHTTQERRSRALVSIMGNKQVISMAFTLCFLLMACAIPAFSQSPVPTKPSGELPVLQLDKSAQFLNSDGLPVNIPSGTYQITSTPPDSLQLTSTSTGAVQTLQATTMTHMESLKAPYPFLIEEAERQGHLHVVIQIGRAHV